MKKSILSILFIFSITFSNAQVWCPPGATWHYDYMNFAVEGFVKFEYNGDTTINTINCKKLDITHSGYSYWNSQNYTYSEKKYTYDSLGVIYFYVDSLSVFDTLYNFDAGPGDKWEMISFHNNHPQCDSVHFVNVLDTGTTIMNSTNLKWLYVNFHYQTDFGIFDSYDTIYERIGTINQYMLPYDGCNAGLDVNEGGTFRCYVDNQFTLLKRTIEDCDEMPIVGVIENNLDSYFEVFPNPTSGILKLENELQYKIESLRLFDNTGKLVLQFKDLPSEINLSGFQNGLYFIELITEGSIIRKKVIIEK